jgi:hypothetical protein
MKPLIYRFAWKNNSKRETLYGRECEILANGKMNTVKVRFLDNGQEEYISRRALRRKDRRNK